MSGPAYEILALIMRYVFAALGLLILVRAFRWLIHDHTAHERERRALPDAGMIGVLEDADSGKRWPLPREGTVGSAMSCDVVIRRRGLRRHHFAYALRPGRGVEIRPVRRARVMVDGRPAEKDCCALSGSAIKAGSGSFRMLLYRSLRLPVREPEQVQDDGWLELFFEDEEDGDSFADHGVPLPERRFGVFDDPRYDMAVEGAEAVNENLFMPDGYSEEESEENKEEDTEETDLTDEALKDEDMDGASDEEADEDEAEEEEDGPAAPFKDEPPDWPQPFADEDKAETGSAGKVTFLFPDRMRKRSTDDRK